MKERIVLLGVLLINSATDLYQRRICIISLIFAFLYRLALICMQKEAGFWLLPSLLPGAALLLLSLLTKGKIGLGDGWLVVCCGFYLELWQMLSVLMLGLVLTGLTGVLLLSLKKAGPKTELPFVPFLAAAYALLWLLKAV